FVPSDCSVIRCTCYDADGVTVLCEDSVSIVRNGTDGEKGEKGDKGDDGQPAVSYNLVRKVETAVTLAVSGTGGDAAFRLAGKFTYGVTKIVGSNDPTAVTAPLTGKYTLEDAECLLTYDADTLLLTGTYTGTQAYTAANAGDIPASVLVTVTFTDNGNTVTLTDTVPVTVGGGVVVAIDNEMGRIRQDVADAQGNISTLRQTAEGLSSKVASIAGGGNLLWDAGFARIVGENTPATRTGVRAFMGRTSSAWVGGTLDGQNCFNVHNTGLASNAYSGITWRVPFSMAGQFAASVQSRVTGVSGGEETQGNIEFVAHAADGTRLKTFFAASAVNRSSAVQGAFRQLWVTGDVAGTYAVGGTVHKVAYIAVNVWLLCNGTVQFAKPQFERGEAPTEWGLSPMDSVHSEIEQSREAIRMGVSDDMRRTGVDITRGLIRIVGEKTRVEGNLDVSDGLVTLRDTEGIDRVRMTSRSVGALDAQTVAATRRFSVIREVAAGTQLRFDMLDGALLALEKDAQFWGSGSISEIYENTGDYNGYSIEITTYEKQADGSLLPTASHAPWNAIIPQVYSYRVRLENASQTAVYSQVSTTDVANGNTDNSSVAYIDPGKVIKAAQKGGYRLYLDVMNGAEIGAEIGASGSAKTYVVRAELILKAVTASKTIIGNDGIYTAHGQNHYLYYGQDGFLAGVERSDLMDGISSVGALRAKKDAYPEVYHYAKNDRLWTKNRATGAAHIAEFAVSDNGQVVYRPHWTNSQGAANYQQTDGAERDTGNVCIVAASTDVVIYDSAVAVRGSQDSSSPILDISRAEYDGHVLELYLIDTDNQGTDGYNTVYIGRGSRMVDLLGKMNAQGYAGHVLPGSTQNTLGLKAVQIERRIRKMRMLFVKEYRTVSEVYNNVWLITGAE
ncbi:MAG: hypothetical protein SPF56_05300, partial [Bacteroidaceae bacterium]|nr:hypothetical protein [Bacteroidaceae bacterium]